MVANVEYNRRRLFVKIVGEISSDYAGMNSSVNNSIKLCRKPKVSMIRY